MNGYFIILRFTYACSLEPDLALNILELIMGNPGVLSWTVTNKVSPETEPNHGDNSRDIKHKDPTKVVRDIAAHEHGDGRSEGHACNM